MNRITVVKIGGNVVDNPVALSRFASDFAAMPGLKVLVHGGGKEATRLSTALGIETVMIDGRRVTSRETLDVVTMVYAGLVNKRVVCQLQGLGCDAMGLSGADGHAITAVRRPAAPVDYGYVGDLSADSVNTGLFMSLCQQGIVPVVCAVMYDGHGSLLNCNADSVATCVATGLAKAGELPAPELYDVDLVFCFEKKGVLRDVDDPDSVVPVVDASNYAPLRESGAISKGMIPKIDNALKAVASGVHSVRICHSDDLNTDSGTVIR